MKLELTPVEYYKAELDQSSIVPSVLDGDIIILLDIGMPSQAVDMLISELGEKGIIALKASECMPTFISQRDREELALKERIDQFILKADSRWDECRDLFLDEKKSFLEPKQTYINHKDKFISKRKFR
jgi:hypothetical protein